MRVLLLSWEYPPHIEGGLGRHVAELAPALARQGVDVHVITPVGEPTVDQLRTLPPEEINIAVRKPALPATITVEDGVVVHRVYTAHKHKTADIYTRVTEVNEVVRLYAEQIREQYGQCMLIHNHDWLTGFAAIALQKSWNCPLVSTIHATARGRARGYLGNHLQWSIDSVERELIYKADQVIVCSRHMFTELQPFFQVPASKMDIVPNGVDLAGLNRLPVEALPEIRRKYAEPDEQIIFTIGRLVYEKGIHRLVEATWRILADCPKIKIFIAGRGPEAENLKGQAMYLGVANYVKFIGFVSDEERNHILQVADCAVFPSLYEPFGIVALEAMALNCPVVVSSVGGLAEVVTHQETGITVFPDDAESIAWGVVQTLTHPEATRQYTSRARQWIEDNFTWERVAAQTVTVYRKVALTVPGRN
jgi:glycosyltransferase involved in cell wall biosynthesis